MLSADRFRELLDSYGGRSSQWPPEHFDEMHAFVVAHPEAEAWIAESRALDELLDSYQPELPDLAASILASAPSSLMDRLLAWLVPDTRSGWWRPAFASAMPLILGVAIGVGDPNTDNAENEELIVWEAQERALINPLASGGSWYE
ncbi:MAG: hypothetical protein AAGG55_00450 [Pseudomonadota bacterium]